MIENEGASKKLIRLWISFCVFFLSFFFQNENCFINYIIK